MARASSTSASHTGTDLPTTNPRPSDQRTANIQPPHFTSSASENGSSGASCQIIILPEIVALSPLTEEPCPITQSTTVDSSSVEFQWKGKEAAPLAEKAGEIGYVVSIDPTLGSASDADNRASASSIAEQSSPATVRSTRPGTSWSPAPTGSSPYAEHGRGISSKPSEKVSGVKMFLKPMLLAFICIAIFIGTLVGFIQVQERIHNSNNKKNNSISVSSNMDGPPELDNHSGAPSANSTSAGGNASSSNASFVYLGTIFIVALLIEFWIFVGAMRRLYHRLGLWVDQEYPLLLPDLSDPEAVTPPLPVLPFWARLLRINPQAIRPPLLPPYIAVLNMIRTGGRSDTNLEGTGDVEDGEVIRNLAIGRGQAAPAFNGEEFKNSTIILSGPPKRNSALSVPASVQSTGGLLRKLSRSLPARFSFRNSTSNPENGANSSTQNS